MVRADKAYSVANKILKVFFSIGTSMMQDIPFCVPYSSCSLLFGGLVLILLIPIFAASFMLLGMLLVCPPFLYALYQDDAARDELKNITKELDFDYKNNHKLKLDVEGNTRTEQQKQTHSMSQYILT